MQIEKYFKKLNHMKFTKENAVESITAKFTDKAKGIDLKRTIDEAVSNGIAMIGENSEMELDAFVGFVEKNVSSALGLARHERSTFSTGLQEQLEELKKKLEGGVPPKPDEQETPIKSDDPVVQKMMEDMAEMKKKLEARETEESILEKRKQLVAKMGESIKDSDWIEAYLSEISITAETDVEAKAKDYVEFYNKTHTKGGKSTPKSTGDDEDDNSGVKSTVAAAAAFKKTLSANRGGATVTTNETK